MGKTNNNNNNNEHVVISHAIGSRKCLGLRSLLTEPGHVWGGADLENELRAYDAKSFLKVAVLMVLYQKCQS